MAVDLCSCSLFWWHWPWCKVTVGWQRQTNQRCILSTTKQAISITLATTVGHLLCDLDFANGNVACSSCFLLFQTHLTCPLCRSGVMGYRAGRNIRSQPWNTDDIWQRLCLCVEDSIQFNSNNFIFSQEIHMWCMTLKTESTGTLQDTKTFSKRQNQSNNTRCSTKGYYKKHVR